MEAIPICVIAHKEVEDAFSYKFYCSNHTFFWESNPEKLSLYQDLLENYWYEGPKQFMDKGSQTQHIGDCKVLSLSEIESKPPIKFSDTIQHINCNYPSIYSISSINIEANVASVYLDPSDEANREPHEVDLNWLKRRHPYLYASYLLNSSSISKN